MTHTHGWAHPLSTVLQVATVEPLGWLLQSEIINKTLNSLVAQSTPLCTDVEG